MDFEELNFSTINTGNIVFSVRYFDSVDSTNLRAFALANNGAPEGLVVIADQQSSGRGRLGRKWHSPAKQNIYASIVLRPSIAPQYASQIPIIVGVAIQKTLGEYIPQITLKWPNDILVGNKKICGILTEMKSSPQHVDFIIVGIGININQCADDFDNAIQKTATSLFLETNIKYHRTEILKKMLFHLGEIYYSYCQDGFDGIKKEWLSCANIIGKKIAVAFKERVLAGVVTDIDDYGALVCRQDDGNIININAGDATIIKE
ncbi:MAG: biotin--[acetyl-CoA-carboxylase] ligase [Deltaproteobacteria bacterium]